MTTTGTQIISTVTAGAPGAGVPTGGTTGQVLTKASSTDRDTAWTDQTGSGSSNIDGGSPASTYGGTSTINGGTP